MKKQLLLAFTLLAVLSIQSQNKISESFENGIPEIWTIIDAGDNNHTWEDTTGAGYDDTDGLWVDCYDSELANDGASDDWLITPQVKYSEDDVLSFWMYGNDPTYTDNLIVMVSVSGTSSADFTIEVANIESTTEWTKYQYKMSDLNGINQGTDIYIGLHAKSNGSRMFLDEVMLGAPTEPTIVDVFAFAENKLALVFDAAVLADQVSSTIRNTTLTGSQDLSLSDPQNWDAADNVILAMTSASMMSDNVLDKLNVDDENKYDFYAGITPVAFSKLTNPNGIIEGGFLATFTGIVSAITDNRVWFADNEGAFGSVNTYGSAFSSEVTAIGDSILLYGEVDHYKNQTEIYPAFLIDILAHNKPVFGPKIISGSDINLTIAPDTDPAEKYEGVYAKILNATILGWDGAYFLCTDDNGINSFYVGDVLGLNPEFGESLFTIGKTYDISGIVTGYGGEYLLAPRSSEDVVLLSLPTKNKIYRFVAPNPANNYFVVSDMNEVQRIEIFNLYGQEVMNLESNHLSDGKIYIQHLEDGVYLVRIINSSSDVTTIKVVKK